MVSVGSFKSSPSPYFASPMKVVFAAVGPLALGDHCRLERMIFGGGKAQHPLPCGLSPHWGLAWLLCTCKSEHQTR